MSILGPLAVLATHLQWQWRGLNARFAAITAHLVRTNRIGVRA